MYLKEKEYKLTLHRNSLQDNTNDANDSGISYLDVNQVADHDDL